MPHDKSHRANAAQFFVAAELCRRGYAALVTIGNTPNTDILCSNKGGTRFVHIQVKTFAPVPGRWRGTCSVGAKAEVNPGPSFFWVLAGIPEPRSDAEFEYFIIPARDMARNVAKHHRQWLETPGKAGRPHRDNPVRVVSVRPGGPNSFWSVEPYRNQWERLDRVLRE